MIGMIRGICYLRDMHTNGKSMDAKPRRCPIAEIATSAGRALTAAE
jgi:hypothetical protein